MSQIPNKINAEASLKNFIENGLGSYAYKRNYDYGHNENSNVSKLSPFIPKKIEFFMSLDLVSVHIFWSHSW